MLIKVLLTLTYLLLLTMAVRGLLDGGSVMVRRMRAFVVASEMGHGGVSILVPAAFTNPSVALLPRTPP